MIRVFGIVILLLSISYSIIYGNFNNKAPLITLADSSAKYKPGNTILTFEDTTGELSFMQIQRLENQFKPRHDINLNSGTTASAFWYVFKVKNSTSENWYIEIGAPYIDYIDFYSIDQNDNASVIKTGLQRKFIYRSIRINQFVLPLNLAQNEEKTYFVRARSFTILKLPMVISTIENHFEVNHVEDLLNGIYFGLLLALSLYNLFVFLLLKDRTYLFYVFYINSLGATIAWLRGYSPEFLSTIPINLNHGNNFAAITFIFLTLFTHYFLNLKKTFPRHRWFMWTFIIISVSTIILTIAGHYIPSFYFVMLIVSINFPYIASFGIYSYIKGFRPAIFYLLGFTFFTIGDFIFILSENGIIDESVLSNNSLQLGSALEAIILSFALANKLNIYKKEKEETQLKALIQAGEFSRDLIKTQEDERKRIAGELHDSVGQSLSLLKNRILLLKRDLHDNNSLDEISNVVSVTIQEIRSITYGLRPLHLDILGLTQSLKSLAEDVSEATKIRFHTSIDNIDGQFTKEEEINIYRIIQECLNNITKHAKANEVILAINKHNDKIEIQIDDNGVGIDSGRNNKGMGMVGIRERVNILKGKMEINSIKHDGTRIKIYI